MTFNFHNHTTKHMRFNSHNHTMWTNSTYHQVRTRREDCPCATACTAEASVEAENAAVRGGEGWGCGGAWGHCLCLGLCLAVAAGLCLAVTTGTTRSGHSNRRGGWEGDRNPCRLAGPFAGEGNAAAEAEAEGERRRKGICRGIREARSWLRPLEFGKP